MKVLVACEFSGIVRDAFIKRGHHAMSCDFIGPEQHDFSNQKHPGQHLKGDVRRFLGRGWDIMIAHPPCTHLAVSGARWFADKLPEQQQALDFVRELLNAPIPKIALENPVSVISTKIRKPDQIIQPWQFGHGETKATCLWLKNLPPLEPTDIVDGRENRIHRGKTESTAGKQNPPRENRIHLLPPSAERSKLRSITFTGIATAMAEQWG